MNLFKKSRIQESVKLRTMKSLNWFYMTKWSQEEDYLDIKERYLKWEIKVLFKLFLVNLGKSCSEKEEVDLVDKKWNIEISFFSNIEKPPEVGDLDFLTLIFINGDLNKKSYKVRE